MIIGAVVATALLVLCQVTETTGFVALVAPQPTICSKTQPLYPLWSSVNDDDITKSARKSGGGSWKLSNDFLLFMNQCAIQSFMLVLSSLRDPQTVRWVDNYTQPVIDIHLVGSREPRLTGTTEATTALTSNPNVANPNGNSYSQLLIYHGIGAMNTTKFATWDSYFEKLLTMPVEAFTIQSYNGMAKEYDIEINPASICARIISVREKIAQEFANDLGVVANMGYHTMDSYWDYIDNQRDEEEDQETEPNQQNDSSAGGGTGEKRKRKQVTMSSGEEGSPRRFPPHNLVFLGWSLDPIDGMAPSTLRKGNFDLAVLLATQESIHRFLNGDLHRDVGNDYPKYRMFLRDFYLERLVSHFSGIQRYNRADDFLEELLFSSGRFSTDEGGAALIDPVLLTEMILDERRAVALEWQAMSKDVPNDHIVIKRLQLEKLMESYNS